MTFVLLIYQGATPLPGTDRWKALPEVGGACDKSLLRCSID